MLKDALKFCHMQQCCLSPNASLHVFKGMNKVDKFFGMRIRLVDFFNVALYVVVDGIVGKIRLVNVAWRLLVY